MMWSRGFNSFRGCFGSGFGGFFNSGWNMLIAAGIILIIATTVFFLVRRNRSTVSSSSALELLTMKYVKGEITEEEYLRRKDVLNRK